jgi:hypothetical protein
MVVWLRSLSLKQSGTLCNGVCASHGLIVEPLDDDEASRLGVALDCPPLTGFAVKGVLHLTIKKPAKAIKTTKTIEIKTSTGTTPRKAD